MELIVNPKSLERQIKMLDERLLELQAEMGALEKKREACHTLLGIPVAPVGVGETPILAKKTSARKKRESEVSESVEEGLDAVASVPTSEGENLSAAH